MEAAAAAATTTISARTSRLSAEGVGARVIRGIDWKWGKQVIQILCNGRLYFILYFLLLLCRTAERVT